jgi:predicted DNA-binding protein YlxM (UPF0122 family)
MAKYKPYSIRTPPFDVCSGGIRVMYGLYGALLAKGQIAYLNAVYDDPFIGVYPEIYNGNDMNAQTVVRYILAPPGEMSHNGYPGPSKFPVTDLIYSFSRMILDIDDRHIMFLPILNTYLFRDQGKERTKKAFFVGKRINLGLHPEGCVEITRQFAIDQQALADLLNECEVMYCYDHRTAMTEIARLCGCRVVVYPSVVTLETFRLYEPGMNGLGWGEDVSLDSKKFREHYLHLKDVFDRKLDLFIKDTQNA